MSHKTQILKLIIQSKTNDTVYQGEKCGLENVLEATEHDLKSEQPSSWPTSDGKEGEAMPS